MLSISTPDASSTLVSSFNTSTYSVNGAFSLEFSSRDSLYARRMSRWGAARAMGNQIATLP